MSRTDDATHQGDALGRLLTSVSSMGKWPATPARVRRAASFKRGVFGHDFLVALTALPQDWWPRDDVSRSGLAILVTLTKDVADHLWHYDFLAGGHPDWYAHLHATFAPFGLTVDDSYGVMSGVLDMVKAFERQVVLPALNREGVTVERTTFYNRPTLAGCVAASLLLGEKRLRAILELSGEWHAARDGIDGTIVPGTGAGMTWPVPFPVLRAPNGVAILGLTSAEELRAEGSAGKRDGIPGLDHCVGGYAGSVAAGHNAILSFRGETEGVLNRLSTMSFRLDGGKLEILEHKGRENGPVPPEAEAAAKWLGKQVRSGRIVPSAEWSSHRWHQTPWLDDIQYDWTDGEAFARAVDAWSPLLSRPLRDTALLSDAAVAEAARIVRHRVPGKEAALVGGRLLPSTVPDWLGISRPPPRPTGLAALIRWPLDLPSTVSDLMEVGRMGGKVRFAARATAIGTVAAAVLVGLACAHAVAVGLIPRGQPIGMALVLAMGAAGITGAWGVASVAKLILTACGRWWWRRRVDRA